MWGTVTCFVLDKKPGCGSEADNHRTYIKSCMRSVVVSMKSSEIVRLTWLRFHSYSLHSVSSHLIIVLFEITLSFPQSLLEPGFLHVSVCRTRVIWYQHFDARVWEFSEKLYFASCQGKPRCDFYPFLVCFCWSCGFLSVVVELSHLALPFSSAVFSTGFRHEDSSDFCCSDESTVWM